MLHLASSSSARLIKSQTITELHHYSHTLGDCLRCGLYGEPWRWTAPVQVRWAAPCALGGLFISCFPTFTLPVVLSSPCTDDLTTLE